MNNNRSSFFISMLIVASMMALFAIVLFSKDKNDSIQSADSINAVNFSSDNATISSSSNSTASPTISPSSSLPLAQPTPPIFTPIGDSPQAINGKTYSVHSAFLDHSIQKSQNGGIYRFEVREGECRSSESDKERAELSGGNYKFPVGTDIWASYSFMVEQGESLSGTANVLGQFHAGTGSPTFSFRLPTDNNLQIVLRVGSSSDYTQIIPYEKNDFVRGRWYNVVIHAKFSPDADAVLQVWIDGEKVVDKSNFVMGYTDSTENYWKFGIYRSTSIPQVEAVQYANMEVGTMDLSSRITNPKPVIP